MFRALRLHPDKGGDPELFKEVTHAYVADTESMFMYLLSVLNADTKFCRTQRSGTYMMHGERQVFLSKVVWEEWIPK